MPRNGSVNIIVAWLGSKYLLVKQAKGVFFLMSDVDAIADDVSVLFYFRKTIFSRIFNFRK